MNYQVDAIQEHYETLRDLAAVHGITTEDGRIPYRFCCTITRDGSGTDLIKLLLTAVRARQVLRFTVWEPAHAAEETERQYSREGWFT